MRSLFARPDVRRLAGAASLLVLAACADRRGDLVSPAADVAADVRPTNTPGTCVTPQQLEGRVAAAFGAGSPDGNSVIGRVRNMVRAVQRGNLTQARGFAYNIVDFVATKHRQRPLPGGDAAVENLLIGVTCFVGLGDPGAEPDNSILIMPQDEPQVLLGRNAQSGVAFPADPVSEPTLVTITTLTPPGPNGPPILLTKLDQYPGYVNITKTSQNSLPLKRTVVVEICPTVTLPEGVAERARLGHQRQPGAAGFEVKPAGDFNFLTCTEVGDARSPLRRALEATFLPRRLEAAMIGGGISGNVNEFSPFGIVDAQLFFDGGISGNVNEFRVEGTRAAGVNLSLGVQTAPCANGIITGPVGQPLPLECRPQIRVRTLRGTPFANVPVTWTLLPGAFGTVAPFTQAGCGSFGGGFTIGTGAVGYSRACWTLGSTVGAQQLRAEVQLGGDANSSEIVFEPATRIFTANAVAPVATQLIFQQQPAEGANVPAGSTIPVQVRVADATGTTVTGFTGPVVLDLRLGATSLPEPVTVNAVGGVATFAFVLPQTVLGEGSFRARATLGETQVSVLGNGFRIVRP
jgi:hypothetical protein